jgi:hypothetical protein
MRRYFIIPALWLVLAGLAAGPVYAACTSPTGNEGDQIYNLAFHTPQFCNGTNWIAMGAPGGGGSLILISTQTASSSASLQFTNLPTSYNTLFLNCTGLLMSNSSTTILVAIGESTGPTWETGAYYTRAFVYSFATSNNGTGYTTTGTDILGLSGSNMSATVPTGFKVYIDNPSSSTMYKNIYFSELGLPSTTTWGGAGGWAYWNNDTNAVTGLEVTASGGGSISSGTCSLYGMN